MRLEADAGRFGQARSPIGNLDPLLQSTEQKIRARRNFVRAKLQSRNGMKGQQVPCMRHHLRPGPLSRFRKPHDIRVFDDTVRKRRVDLDQVFVRAKTSIAHEVIRLRHRKQILARRDSAVVIAGQRRQELEIVRVARFLDPCQAVGRISVRHFLRLAGRILSRR